MVTAWNCHLRQGASPITLRTARLHRRQLEDGGAGDGDDVESSKEVLGPEWGVGDRVKADWVSAGPAQARARNNVNTSRRVRGDLPNIALYERIADATALSLVD